MTEYEKFIFSLTNKARMQPLNKIDAGILRSEGRVGELEDEIERLSPKPLLFDTLGGFKVIVNNNVPKNEIWFATDKQLQVALEYSVQQIKKALNHK